MFHLWSFSSTRTLLFQPSVSRHPTSRHHRNYCVRGWKGNQRQGFSFWEASLWLSHWVCAILQDVMRTKFCKWNQNKCSIRVMDKCSCFGGVTNSWWSVHCCSDLPVDSNFRISRSHFRANTFLPRMLTLLSFFFSFLPFRGSISRSILAFSFFAWLLCSRVKRSQIGFQLPGRIRNGWIGNM